jgi:hypothetical protein
LAVTGTATAKWTDQHHWKVVLLGVTQGSVSQSFVGKALPYSSFVAQGTYGAGASLQWQGSNDAGTTWVSTGSAISTDPWAGTITPGGMSFEMYRLNVTSGDGTTSINVYVDFSPQN